MKHIIMFYLLIFFLFTHYFQIQSYVFFDNTSNLQIPSICSGITKDPKLITKPITTKRLLINQILNKLDWSDPRKIVLFMDIDGTITNPLEPVPKEMADELNKLSHYCQLVFITGGPYKGNCNGKTTGISATMIPFLKPKRDTTIHFYVENSGYGLGLSEAGETRKGYMHNPLSQEKKKQIKTGIENILHKYPKLKKLLSLPENGLREDRETSIGLCIMGENSPYFQAMIAGSFGTEMRIMLEKIDPNLDYCDSGHGFSDITFKGGKASPMKDFLTHIYPFRNNGNFNPKRMLVLCDNYLGNDQAMAHFHSDIQVISVGDKRSNSNLPSNVTLFENGRWKISHEILREVLVKCKVQRISAQVAKKDQSLMFLKTAA